MACALAPDGALTLFEVLLALLPPAPLAALLWDRPAFGVVVTLPPVGTLAFLVALLVLADPALLLELELFACGDELVEILVGAP